jgi:hypothetical protein
MVGGSWRVEHGAIRGLDLPGLISSHQALALRMQNAS